MKNKIYRIFVFLMAVVVFLFASVSLGDLLMPIRLDYGSNWEGYLQEPEDSIDVMYFGSSIVYCDIIPAVVYEHTGITSYVVSGPELTMPMTYYYVKEACKTQHPKTILVELNGLFFPHTTGYTKVTVGYMPWGINRLQATFTAAEPELRFGLLYPLYNYHSLLTKTHNSDIETHLNPNMDLWAGYTPLVKSKPMESVFDRNYTLERDYSSNLHYLQLISEFCSNEGISLILYTAPASARIPAQIQEQMLEDLSALTYADFWDGNVDFDLEDVDPSTDWYDTLHFNIYGAEKFSRALGTKLAELLPSTEHPDEDLWQQRIDTFYAFLRNPES